MWLYVTPLICKDLGFYNQTVVIEYFAATYDCTTLNYHGYLELIKVLIVGFGIGFNFFLNLILYRLNQHSTFFYLVNPKFTGIREFTGEITNTLHPAVTIYQKIAEKRNNCSKFGF